MDSTRSVWVISAVIEATQDDAQAAAEAIGAALCPEPVHEGYCRVPWTTMVVRFEDLEPEEQASWRDAFNEERSAAHEVGGPGAGLGGCFPCR